MDNYVRKVKIKSLFERDNNLEIFFTETTNCIYGDNGTGKTTVINLIVSALKCDIKKLVDIPFHSLEIMTAKRGTRRACKAIKIEKISDSNLEYYVYSSNITVSIDIQNEDKDNNKKIDDLVCSLNKLLHLTYVPLSRLGYNDPTSYESDSYLLNRSLRARNFSQAEILDIMDASRRMLGLIEKEFVDRYASIQKKISIDSAKMKNNVVQKVLIDKSFIRKVDTIHMKIHSARNLVIRTNNPQEILNKFKEANIEVLPSSLDEHFKLYDDITKEFETAKTKYNQEDSSSTQNYSKAYYRKFATVVMLECLSSIISDIETIEKNKNEYLQMYNVTESVINEFFLPRKKFYFNSKGGFAVDCNGNDINISNLSSGEKHLIALLGRVALQYSGASVFLADEPELSLHLDWQRSLISSMKKLSPNMQIIVATHSPAIIPSDSNQIDLEDCKI